MFNEEFSDKIIFTISDGQSIELDQKRVHIRENQKGLMALSYVAPVFEAMDIEKFFSKLLTSEKLTMDIGNTGDFSVCFRGIVDGKGENFPNNFEHKIILLQGFYSDSRIDFETKGFSRFKLKDELSD